MLVVVHFIEIIWIRNVFFYKICNLNLMVNRLRHHSVLVKSLRVLGFSIFIHFKPNPNLVFCVVVYGSAVSVVSGGLR